ncbi:MAG: hypothetical protein AMS17_13840 [Spirochaetes bacterium DG_61]|nr:MAG: hypothetical protein AMS17_13840 [Spirochaetes bacterium DG_61]
MIEIYLRDTPPSLDAYLEVLERAYTTLASENPKVRPSSSAGMPGGIVQLKQNIPTIIVPDIHARIDFFLNILLSENSDGWSNLQMLAADMLQVVCVGDGFHAEARAVERWDRAFQEYRESYKRHRAMDEEMRESLGVMEMVQEVKCAFPLNFHFLKGNHENIRNEHEEGNYAFRKFTYEGEMVLYYMEKFYGEEFLDSYARFEKSLPLLAVGRNFLVSHAEPMSLYDREDIIEYRERPEVVYGLTWTANDEAEEGSVRRMLSYYLDEENVEEYYYFGGHRPIRDLYHLRAEGRYVQFHNPDRFIIALIQPEGPIDLDRDILELENNLGTYINT